MQRAHVVFEQRQHPRAHLRLPARLRWPGPLGMQLEVTQTIDVSRNGVLLRREENALALMSRVWIVVPFEADAYRGPQPETPARVVRVNPAPGGGYRVSLHLESPCRPSRPLPRSERRVSPRMCFSLPIFVRPVGTPWPEESMTRDVSRHGLRFETSHVYSAGDTVLANIPWGPWAEGGEISGRVLRVETSHGHERASGHPAGASAVLSCVAVQWTQQEGNSPFPAHAPNPRTG